MRRVVVTGLGAMSPFGAGVKVFWDGLRTGACAIRELSLVDPTGFRCRLAAEFPGELPGSERRPRADRLALAAAREAVDDAGLDARERAATALVVGAIGGGMREVEAWYWAWRGGASRPRWALRSTLPCSHAATLTSALGLGGPAETVVAACSSGAAAVAMAADLVAEGVVDVALAGGVDALTRICFMGFNALRLVDPGPCRPFDRDRRGMSVGEGAAFVVLEEAGHARARGGRSRGVLLGHANATDAHHPTSPHPEGEGMIRAMRACLGAARLAADEIDYVNAHGTGTVQNDRVEARALRAVFGEGRTLVSATKSQIGHTMAAAGALEALATLLALQHGTVPPTVHLVNPDPEMSFDCVPGTAREAPIAHALSNSFGFGGQNVALAFGRDR